MLDNLRDDADNSSYFDDADDDLPDFLEDDEEEIKPKTDSFAFLKPVLDLTPVQRFVIAFLLFMAVCLIGSMALLVFERFAIF